METVEGESLRPIGDPELALDPPAISDVLAFGDGATYRIDLDNRGGAPVNYDVVGLGGLWLSVDRSSGSVWPGGTPYGVNVSVDGQFLDIGANSGRLIFTSDSVTSPDTVEVTIVVNDPTGVGLGSGLPDRLALEATGRNPSAGESTLLLALPLPEVVDVAVFDVRGRRVRTLLGGDRPAGRHRVEWDGRDATGQPARPGVYFVRAAAGGDSVVRKVVVGGAR